MMPRPPTLGLVGALLALSLHPSEAAASPTLDTVGSVGGTGGAQGVTTGASAGSTYFNPALLGEAEEGGVIGFSLVSEQIGVTLDGRSGGDVPLVVGERDVLGADRAPIPNDVVPTPWLRDGCEPGSEQGKCPPPGFAARPRQGRGSGQKTRSYLVLGGVKRVVSDRLTIGAYAMLPLGAFTTARAFYPDEREALFSNSLHPELYGDRLTAISISTGASFEVLPELAVGVGLGISFANAATSSTYVRDTTNYDTLLIDNAVRTEVGVSPVFGVRWRPTSRLRVGGAVHAPERFELDTAISATLPSGTESSTSRSEVYHFMPWRVSFGVEADVVRQGTHVLSAVASVRYGLWSAYLDRHGQRPSDYGAGLGFRDTLTVSGGLRHQIGPARLFTDFTFVPSPVPDQVGRSSYVDNDRLGALAGVDVELKLGRARLRPGVQLFASRLVRRYVRKDDARVRDELPDGAVIGATRDPVPGSEGLQTNNPGWPGFASSGWISGGAFTLTVPL